MNWTMIFTELKRIQILKLQFSTYCSHTVDVATVS